MSVAARELSNELTALYEESNQLRRKLERAAGKARNVAGEDAFPMEFAGVVRNYRYAAGKKGEMPSHRFELECGRGVWLFVSCGSTVFEKFLRDMDMGEKPVGKGLNGQVVMVMRDPQNNLLYPTGCAGEVLGTDANGQFLYKGAKVAFDGLEGVISRKREDTDYLIVDGVAGYEVGYNVLPSNVVRVL